jgi:hypothetical protein
MNGLCIVLMQEEDRSFPIGKPRTEFEDPINSLLVVVNKLVDLESRMDYQDSPIEEIQDSLRRIIDLLERLKK